MDLTEKSPQGSFKQEIQEVRGEADGQGEGTEASRGGGRGAGSEPDREGCPEME